MPLALSLALRDLRGGLSGFGIFLACIALGVAAITGVGAVSRSLSDGLAAQGRTILGGDVSFDLIQRPAAPDELAFFRARGRLAPIAVLRAMARADDGSTGLIELKAVGPDYPSAGQVVLDPPMPLADALAARDGTLGVVVDAALKARLGLAIGAPIHIGVATYHLSAVLVQEPDKLAAGIGLGPRVIISDAGLDASGLVQPGSLIRRLYRISLPDEGAGQPAGAAELQRLVSAAGKRFPAAGWEVRTRENVSPEFSRDLARFTQFLTLVGLTALVIGGVGVANAIRGFVERKRPSIATLKSLGATGTYVFTTMLIEVMLIAAIGIFVGLLIGAALPFAVAAAFKAVLPFPLLPSVYPSQIATGLAYGALTALAFSLGPLGRAHDIPVSALFRDQIEPDARRLRWRYRFMVGLAGAALVGTILLLSTGRTLAIDYLVATAAGFVALRLVAFALMRLARTMPHSRHVALRLAVANMHRPGALTPTVVLSLGLGLALLVTLALIDGNIRAQLARTVPGETPSFFFLDVQSAEASDFATFFAAQGARWANRARPDDARADHAGRRHAGRSGQADREIGLGAPRRPRHHLRRDGAERLDARARPVVAGRLRRQAAGLARARHRRRLGFEDRRRHYGQRVRPRDHRDDRQPAHRRLAQIRHQFRVGLLAEHVRWRALWRSGDRDVRDERRVRARTRPAS